MHLVADIGGTNARVAIAAKKDAAPRHVKSFKNANYVSLEAVFEDYLADGQIMSLTSVVVAIAGPVSANVGRMTNLPWIVDGAALSQRFDGVPAKVINDLTALGFASLHLSEDQLIPLHSPAPKASQLNQALVVGIGTGFNVSPILVHNQTTFCPSVEAGHASLSSSVCQALDHIAPGLPDAFQTVEDLFSGKGRVKFVAACTGIETAEIARYILAPTDQGVEAIERALNHYARLIGLLLRDLQLAYLPESGIFLAGGVARSALQGRRADLCIDAFQAPGRFLDTQVATWIINDDAAALMGCVLAV